MVACHGGHPEGVANRDRASRRDPREESKGLPSFDSGSGEYDTIDRSSLQGLGGHRHGQISLARTSWAYSEGDIVFAYGFDIFLLPRGLGMDRRLAAGSLDTLVIERFQGPGPMLFNDFQRLIEFSDPNRAATLEGLLEC